MSNQLAPSPTRIAIADPRMPPQSVRIRASNQSEYTFLFVLISGTITASVSSSRSSQQQTMSGDQNKPANLTAITWDHAVNSQALLTRALESKRYRHTVSVFRCLINFIMATDC